MSLSGLGAFQTTSPLDLLSRVLVQSILTPQVSPLSQSSNSLLPLLNLLLSTPDDVPAKPSKNVASYPKLDNPDYTDKYTTKKSIHKYEEPEPSPEYDMPPATPSPEYDVPPATPSPEYDVPPATPSPETDVAPAPVAAPAPPPAPEPAPPPPPPPVEETPPASTDPTGRIKGDPRGFDEEPRIVGEPRGFDAPRITGEPRGF